APKDFRNATYNFGPTVTSGAFTFGRWDKTSQVVLNANPKFYGGRPNLDQYVIKNAPDSIATVHQLKDGELDGGGIDPSLWEDTATATNLNRIRFQGPGWEWYGYQVDPNNPKGRASGRIFSDKSVRQALYMAVDRQKLADRVYFKQAVPAPSILAATSWALSSDVPKYPYDPSKAKAMLDAAGWAVGADGVRAKGGVKLAFDIITNQGNKTRESVVQVLAESWKAIGANATVKLITFSEYTKTRQTLDFDVVMGGITYGVDPSDINSMYEAKFIGKSANRMGYRNSQVDDLLEKAVITTDRAKRKDLYVQVQKIVMEDMPVGPLVLGQSLWGINKRVQNFTPGPFNRYQARPWLKDGGVTYGKCSPTAPGDGSGMLGRYVARRALVAVVVLLGVTVITFGLMHSTGGDYVPGVNYDNPHLRTETITAIRHEYGLDQPWWVQYGLWLWNVLHLDFGRSMIDGAPVTDHIVQRLPNTLELTVAAILFGVALSIPAGVVSALRRGERLAHSLTTMSVAGFAVPEFWLGLMVILLFGVIPAQRLGVPLLPTSGAYDPLAGGFDPLDRLTHLVLPAVVLGFAYLSIWSRFTRSSMLEVLSQDYVRTARAKGMGERRV